MEFIDHTGHIFSIPSFSEHPVGYEYEENPYIFWVNKNEKLSVDNYYILPIRIVLDDSYDFDNNADNISLSIKCDSTVFSLLNSLDIQNTLNNCENIFDYFTINSDIFKQELTEDNVITLTHLTDDDNNEYSMITFYIVTYSEEAETMLTNMLITVKNIDEYVYCPITVGAEFVDENEMLIINGKNMGINLPKDIIRAIYKSSFYNDVADEELYNRKLKELILNYMGIKGECGNFNSAINALKWFEWGKRLNIVKLLQTDNQFIDQYIFDKFDVINDVITSYKSFRTSSFIKLTVYGTEETDEINLQNYYKAFWGEGLPIIKNIVNNTNYVTYDENDIRFYKQYYDFMFEELGLKLASLEYYYKKYFLPIHLFIHSASIQFQCFMNDKKWIVAQNNIIITENPEITCDIVDNVSVTFPQEHYIMLYTQPHYIDDNYNEFIKYIVNHDDYNTSESDTDLYWVDDNCMRIPIRFLQDNEEQFFDCHLILEKVDKVTYNYLYTCEDITYYDVLKLNTLDEEGNSNNKLLISHKLFDVDYEAQSLSESDEWSDYLTYTEFKQYINDNYITKLPFNTDIPNFTVKIKTINYLTSLLFGKIEYIETVNCDILDDNHTIIFEKVFSFTQKKSDINTHYNNFIIIPKLLGKYNNVNFWKDNEFNLYIMVNGTWYTYNFICLVPEFQIDLGKLYYKYYVDTTDRYNSQHGDLTFFNQLRYLSDDTVRFNYFMWQPKLVTVNNIDFFEDLLNYYKYFKYNLIEDNDNLNVITYNGETITSIDGNIVENYINEDELDIPVNALYYVITLNGQKFYISNDVISNYFINDGNNYFVINTKQLTEDNLTSDYIAYYTSEDILEFTALYGENNYSNSSLYKGSSGILNLNSGDSENILITNEDGNTIKFTTLKKNVVNTDILNADDSNNYVFVMESEEGSTGTMLYIFFEIDENNSIHFFIKDIYSNTVYLNIEKTIYKDFNVLLDKYKEFPNISNNSSYLNRVHLYDIYKNGEQLIYDNTEDIVKLYNVFFNQDEQYTEKVYLSEMQDIYDLYIMHNNAVWYSLFISKNTKDTLLANEVDINDDNKELILYNKISEAKTIEEINTAIINKVVLETGLTFDFDTTKSDIFIIFNTLAEDEGLSNEEKFKRYLINSLYNTNRGTTIKTQYDVDDYIVWNSDNEDAISQNWEGIPADSIYCPYCNTQNISVIYKSDTNQYVYKCNNCGKEFGYYDVTDNILEWNAESRYRQYKLIYKISDDENYHAAQQYVNTKYMYSLNNALYYLYKDNASNKIYITTPYGNVNIDDDSFITSYNGFKLEDYKYDSSTDTYIGKYTFNDGTNTTTGEYYLTEDGETRVVIKDESDETTHELDYVEGINNYQIEYYYKLTTLELQPETVIITDDSILNEFYLLYDGSLLYHDTWTLVLSIGATDDYDMHNIINIYKLDDTKLSWVINPSFNYNSSIYNYKYLENGEYVYITFTDGKPDTQIYLDQFKNFFIIKFNENNKAYKCDVIRELNEESSDIFSLYDVNTKNKYNLDDDNIFYNNESWISEHESKVTEIKNKAAFYASLHKDDLEKDMLEHPDRYMPETDNLYYLYNEYEEGGIIVPNFIVLVYTLNAQAETETIWYYIINGNKYTYEITDETKIISITSTSMTIDISDNPILVKLTLIEGQPYKHEYYDVKDKYTLKYVKSDDKFLINRMQYLPSNGINHFNTNDIIVATLSPKMDYLTDTKFEFKLDYGSKWIFEPMSLRIPNNSTVTSTTELALMSIGNKNVKYNKGYYNLICNYSLDSNTQNIYSSTARILVK